LRTNPSYPAARSIAPKVRAHFARHAKATHQPGAPLPLLPDTDAIEAIVDAAFWASLRREEGYVPRISLALLEPSQAAHPLMFERPIPLAPASLVRIAPAVERRGIHLGVWQNGELLEVWGTTWLIPSSCFVLEVVAPGLLVVKHNRDGAGGKFVNVAVLEGDQIKIIDERASALPDCPVFVTSLLGFDAGGKNGGAVDVLVQLAVSMRTHGRGVLGAPAVFGLRRDRAGDPERSGERSMAGGARRGRERGGGPDGRGRRHGADRSLRAAGVWREDRAP
jgi:hypothetical protein